MLGRCGGRGAFSARVEAFVDLDRDLLAGFFACFPAQVGLYRQLVSTIAERHKGARGSPGDVLAPDACTSR